MSGDPDNKRGLTHLKKIRAIKRAKDDADAHYKAGSHRAAEARYTDALALCPDNRPLRAKLHHNRAACRSSLRDHRGAVDDCGAALLADRGYLKAYLRRATGLLALGEPADCEGAVRDLERAHELCPEEQKREIAGKVRKAQVQLKRSKQKNFYKILGVTQDATEAEIKKGYRKLALKYHPDRQAGKSEAEKKKSEDTFRDVNLAYEVLSDPPKRRRYDDGVEEQDLDNPNAQPGGHGGHGHGGGGMGGIDPNVLFQMFMQQQQQGGGGGRGGGHGGFHFG